MVHSHKYRQPPHLRNIVQFAKARSLAVYRTVEILMCLQSLSCSQVKVPMICFGTVSRQVGMNVSLLLMMFI